MLNLFQFLRDYQRNHSIRYVSVAFVIIILCSIIRCSKEEKPEDEPRVHLTVITGKGTEEDERQQDGECGERQLFHGRDLYEPE